MMPFFLLKNFDKSRIFRILVEMFNLKYQKMENNFHSILVFKKDLDHMTERQLRNTLLEVESLKNAIENKLWGI